jgi:hypothetical protein
LTVEEPEPTIPQHPDEDERMEVDDDFIPGCAILNIDIDRLPFPKIWIRAEYIRIYNYLESRETPPRIDNHIPPAAVVTGQPGIGEFSFSNWNTITDMYMREGKSVWVYYALC